MRPEMMQRKLSTHPAGRENQITRRQTNFRVQLRDLESNRWYAYANFHFPGEAEACLHELSQRGIEARIDHEPRHMAT